MKHTAVLLIILLYLPSFAQTGEIYYSNPEHNSVNYYITFKPEGQLKGLLLLLTSFGESPQTASKETEIPKIATKNGLLTVIASLQDGNMTFFVDSLSQATLDKLILELLEKYELKGKPFYMGGFSLGGSGVVKYAERAYNLEYLPKPNAVFAIDPPLDFERAYHSLEHTIRYNKILVAKREAEYFIKRIMYELNGSPVDNILNYYSVSPYSHSDTTMKNVRSLVDYPIRLIIEPDIIWQIENRNRGYYDLNAIDCAAVINTLNMLGNKNAMLVTTTNKGYRKITGNRNTHSWSIADADQTIKWLLQF